MKLLLDENLAPRLAETLSDLYPGTAHVQKLGLASAQDDDIWNYAKAHGFAIVSNDSDFAERSVLEIQPPKILWMRIGNCSTNEIETLLRTQFEAIRAFLDDADTTCLLLGR